jgi:uncharacterized glyoxalase superfamily protein PhnB
MTDMTDMTDMTEMTDSSTGNPVIWPTLLYDDAPAAIEFLKEAFGFTEQLVVRNDDGTTIEHAQLRWPAGGGVMLGSAGRPDNPFSQRPTGAASLYVVTDDPDGLCERAMAHGATLVVTPSVVDGQAAGLC